MNTNDPRFEIIRQSRDGNASSEELAQLEASLREDPDFRETYVRYMNLDMALGTVAKAAPRPAPTALRQPARWFTWRPLTAAAAGIVFGMLCTSVVFGYVTQRSAVRKMPLSVYDAGLEDPKQTLNDGLPSQAGQWGIDNAKMVPAEGGITPLAGNHMLRLEQIPRESTVRNHTSRAYQVLDLRSLPASAMTNDTEVEVSASFCATNNDTSSRYLIRAIALDEAPVQATKNFWSKVESDGVVSESQRFDSVPGSAGWQTFSMTLRLPPGSKTLALIFGAVPPEDASLPASVHYLDEVQVSLLSSETSLP
ncbi:MAG: hypothetical protein NTV80_11585 [Verrucomicrobia bacterium]|nr:hypothetical protein [Verrucomicrobiota bacterium]